MSRGPRPPVEPDTETYLGDGVMAGHDGFHVWLYLAPGHAPRDARDGIALDPVAVNRLEAFVERMREPEEEESDDEHEYDPHREMR